MNRVSSISNITKTICSGSDTAISPLDGSGNVVPNDTTYTWTVVDNANVTGESSLGSTSPIGASNTNDPGWNYGFGDFFM